MRVEFPTDCLAKLLEAIEWQADYYAVIAEQGSPRAFVHIVESIQAQAGRQTGQALRIDVADDNLELVTEALEHYYSTMHGPLFEDKYYILLIEVFREAEDACLVAAGKKPPVRESLDPAVHHSDVIKLFSSK